MTHTQITRIKALRKSGHSYPEIAQKVGKSKSQVWRYAHEVEVSPENIMPLRYKRGGSHQRSQEGWKEAQQVAQELFGKQDMKKYLFPLACLYWGEGSKSEFNFTNTDPQMIKVFVTCIVRLGILQENLIISIRIFEDMIFRQNEIAQFWADMIDIPVEQVYTFNILPGKKLGKLKYGMCRIRVKTSREMFKLVMCAIEIVKGEIIGHVPIAQWTEPQTPKL